MRPPSPIPDTPLFVKTHDFLLWLIKHTQRFPKNLRHTYTHRLEAAALEFQESILMGNAERGEGRSHWLLQADGRLLCLRALLRLAMGMSLLGGNQVRYAAERVDELGRLLGALEEGHGPHSAGASRVIRGGSFNNNARNCRAANRNNNAPSNRNNNIGFRVCLVR